MIQTAEIKKRSGARPHRPVLAPVICAHRNNLETHTRTIGVTAPIVNHRSIRSRRAPRRHPSLTKCELAEGSSAALRQLPAVVIYGARLAGLGELEFQRERREVGIAN